MAAPYRWSTHPADALEADLQAVEDERASLPDGPCEDRLPGEGLSDRDFEE